MEDNENWLKELDIGVFSLIDEDDNLLSSSFIDPTSYEFSGPDKDDKGLSLFGDEILVSTLEKKEVLQPNESPEPLKMMKYNLRTSLAWDKAFFTNQGVLEPNELCSMIESYHVGERKILPPVQEDVNRSTESISTLRSDCTFESSQDFVKFEDAIASIQRSASSYAATPDKSKESGATPNPSPTLEDPCAQEKMKLNGSRKKPSIRAEGLGKATKQLVAAKDHNTSISRSISGPSLTQRASVDVNKNKQEKNSKLAGGKDPSTPRVPFPRRTQSSKPVVPFKSALRSIDASKNELASSCSSLESCVSVSSSASNKSSPDSVNQKKTQSLRIAPHSLANGSTSRGASRNIGQPKIQPLSAIRTSKSKLSSSVLSRSSSVDWSSKSMQASTPNKMAKGNKKTVPDDKTHTLKPLNNSKDASAVEDDLKPDKQGEKRGIVVNGGAVNSASITRPSTGLRVPSQKHGYFDRAMNSVARPSTGSRSPNESTSRTKSGKSQLIRSPLKQESTNSKLKVSPALRTSRLNLAASANNIAR